MDLLRTTAHRVVCALLLTLPACGGDSSGPSVGPPETLSPVTGGNQTGTAGRSLTDPLVVKVSDSKGQAISGVGVNFTVVAGTGTLGAGSVQTSADGTASTTWTLGREAGAEQRVNATVQKQGGSTLTVSFSATARAGAATALARVSGDAQQGGAGAPLRDSLVVRVTDEFGNGVQGITVTWSAQGGGTVSPATSVSDATGRATTRVTMGDALGSVSVTASAPSVPAATFTANAVLGITAIAPALLEPGVTATITGVNFSPTPSANTLSIGGIAIAVQTATATTLTAVLPAIMPCLPGGDAIISLTSGGITANRRHPVRTATPRVITPGQILIGTSTDPLHCLELPQDGGRYLIAVANGSPSPISSASLRVRGVASTGTPATVTMLANHNVDHAQADPMGALERRSQHMDLLDRNNALLTDLLRTSGPRSPVQPQVNTQQAPPNVGDTLSIRIPRINLTGANAGCLSYDSIRARVVAVGTRSAVLEDIANPLVGTMDTLYQRLATDFDATQYTAVANNFGDPLLLDATLDNNGKLLMVFSNRVNTMGVDIVGFVWSGDFFTRSQCPQSNLAEVFYGVVPTVNNQNYGDGNGTIGAWFWNMRSTVVHEVKHIAHFALRISRNAATEEPWLEEGSAMIVEEIWARSIFGYAQRGNTGYLQSVGCEIRGAFNVGTCAGRPGVTWVHFGFLADWMDAPSTQSLLCASRTQCTGNSIYGTGWLFLRWLLDQAAQPEATLLRALHQATELGVANIEARFGRPFAQLFADWTLAVALDDRPGFTSSNSLYTMPSWNLRDVYAGLFTEQPQAFPTMFPLLQATMTYGNTEINLATIRGGSAAFFELSGTPVGRQVLEFTSTTGQPLSSTARVTIVRIQ